MSDIKLFHYNAGGAAELAGKSAAIEKALQNLIESQMETFLGVRFLASEYSTGAKHRGRIDSLGQTASCLSCCRWQQLCPFSRKPCEV